MNDGNQRRETDRLEVVIATTPAGVSLAGEAHLLKPAVLYGDSVRLFSPLATLLSSFAALAEAEGLERAQAMQAIAEAMGVPQAAQIAAIVPGMAAIQQMPRRERRQLLGGKKSNEFRDLLQQLDATWEELRYKVEEILDQAGAQELIPAIEAGLLQIEALLDQDADVDQMIATFVSKLGEVLSDGRSYPLFDDATGDLVRAGVSEGLFSLPGMSMSRGREIGAASELLGYLPAFPQASLSDILEIRDELQKPLIKFRAAMVRLARLIDTEPYEAEFREAVEQIFREEVAPAIEELREEVEANSYLRQLAGEAVRDMPKWLGAGFIAAATTPWSQIPELIVAGASAIEPAVKAGWSRHRNAKQISQNQYYFLYETNNLLK